ncbi:MAG: His/Gly/Thr/Pro-type tRNA ligase C-terminal domain-containing protein, partial [Bacteroidales bacterium]|nr:His/Gly/Thr/Pro-type tRNA ligase C-terminal domain-containing protein [Bacteroidales bacterium]
IDYANSIKSKMEAKELRGCIDTRAEKTGRKIRDAEVKKMPYILLVGENEQSNGTVSVRKHGGVDMGTMTIDEFIDLINKEVEKELSK